ncbi:MAG: hypothetical protein ABIT83_17820 [Massilia sp.]
MKKFSMLYAVLLAMSGCGGGGAEVADTNTTPAQAAVQPPPVLAPYVGTWVSDCSDHSQQAMVISISQDGVLSASLSEKVFAAAGCSGAVIGTETMNEN